MPETKSIQPEMPGLKWYHFRPLLKLCKFHYSLRLLIIFVTVCVVVFAFYRMKADEAERQRQSVAAIRKLGGVVGYDYQQVDPHYKPNSRNFLRWSNGWVSYMDGRLDPPGPDWFADWVGIDLLADVVTINLRDSKFTDEWLKHLMEMTKLERLNLNNTQVTAEDVAELQKVLPNCKISWDKPPTNSE